MLFNSNLIFKKVIAFSIVGICSNQIFAASETAENTQDFELSGNITLTSDYRFRGITQTQTDPAIQGTATLTHKSGLYFSAFASNVDYGTADPHMELDPSIGYSTPLKLSSSVPVTLDIGASYYNYISGNEGDYAELYARLILERILINDDSLLTSLSYTNDYAGQDKNSWNATLGYAVPLAQTNFGAVASIGYTTVDDYDFNQQGENSYFDYKAGLTYNFASFPDASAELAVVGTNLDKDALDHAGKRGVDTGAVFTLTKVF